MYIDYQKVLIISLISLNDFCVLFLFCSGLLHRYYGCSSSGVALSTKSRRVRSCGFESS